MLKHYVNLGIAAATPRGLIVPNIKDADQLSLRELAVALAELTETARAGHDHPGRPDRRHDHDHQHRRVRRRRRHADPQSRASRASSRSARSRAGRGWSTSRSCRAGSRRSRCRSTTGSSTASRGRGSWPTWPASWPTPGSRCSDRDPVHLTGHDAIVHGSCDDDCVRVRDARIRRGLRSCWRPAPSPGGRCGEQASALRAGVDSPRRLSVNAARRQPRPPVSLGRSERRRPRPSRPTSAASAGRARDAEPARSRAAGDRAGRADRRVDDAGRRADPGRDPGLAASVVDRRCSTRDGRGRVHGGGGATLPPTAVAGDRAAGDPHHDRRRRTSSPTSRAQGRRHRQHRRRSELGRLAGGGRRARPGQLLVDGVRRRRQRRARRVRPLLPGCRSIRARRSCCCLGDAGQLAAAAVQHVRAAPAAARAGPHRRAHRAAESGRAARTAAHRPAAAGRDPTATSPSSSSPSTDWPN